MPQCWNVLECSLEHREKCAVYPFKGHQCWMVDERECMDSHSGDNESRDCRECLFFQIMMARRRQGER